MEDVKCRKLVATYQDEKLILEGPKFLKFQVDENVLVEIEQLGTRIITIIFVEEDSFRELYGILTKVERLLMIIDGRFIPLKELLFDDFENGTSEHLKSYSENIMNSRLSYYKSADFCNYELDKLIDFETIITSKLFADWQSILDELSIVHQMFLY